MLKVSLLIEKAKLNIIKEKRKGVNSEELSQKYNLKLDDIYQLFANNLFLFGYAIPNIIKEIINSSEQGIDYLKNSEQFLFIIEKLSEENIDFWRNLLFGNELEKNKSLQLELKKILLDKK